MPRKKPPDKFKFMIERSLKEEKFEMTRWQSTQLRAKLQKGIYYLQIEKGGLIHWNWTLLKSYLINGADCPTHQALLEEYMDTLA